MLALCTSAFGRVSRYRSSRLAHSHGSSASRSSRSFVSKRALPEGPPHPWRQVVLDTLAPEQLLLDPKIIHGRSRDYSWRNPYLRWLLTMPFETNHASKASLFEARDRGDISMAARMCHANNIPMVIRGEGTGSTGGAYNLASGLVVDVKKLNRIIDLDASKGTITVESGASIDDIRETALSVGWDMRQYPASNVTHRTTIGGFLQTTPYGIGSTQHGSLLDFGNIVDMKVIPIDASSHEISLDGVIDRKEILGACRSLGTSAVVSEVTLALTPAQYWVDAAATFSTVEEAMKFAYYVQRSPTVFSREIAVMPSSMLTATLNLGERKNTIHFLQHKIPPADHVQEKVLGIEDVVSYDTQDFIMPDSLPETEVMVLLSVNEASLPFLNHNIRERGGHTIYLEHNRGGFGWLEATVWQQAAFRISRYFNGTPFSHFEIGFDRVDASSLNEIPRRMEAISRMVAETVQTSRDPLPDGSECVDESHFLRDDIKHRPAWFVEFIKRPDGDTGIVGQTNFRIQTENYPQLERRLKLINNNVQQLRNDGNIGTIMNPNTITAQEVYMDSTSEMIDLQREAKQRFDPKGLLNPRKILV